MVFLEPIMSGVNGDAGLAKPCSGSGKQSPTGDRIHFKGFTDKSVESCKF